MIRRFLKWLGVIYEPPVKKEQVEAWPFPAVTEDFEPRPKKKRMTVPKATTRKVVAKKAAVKKTTKAKKK